MHAQSTFDGPLASILQPWLDRYCSEWRAQGVRWVVVGAVLGLGYLVVAWCAGFEVANRSAIGDLLGDAMGSSQSLLTLVFMLAALAASIHAMVPVDVVDRVFRSLDRLVMATAVRMSASVIGLGFVGGAHYGVTRQGMGGALALLAIWFAVMLASGSVMLSIVRSFSGAQHGRFMGAFVFTGMVGFCALQLWLQLVN